ncbi:hypothetical protein [Nocardioides pacificus]
MRRRDLAAVLVALALVCLGLGVGPSSAEPAQSPDPAVPREVSGAVFRWGVSNQSNARSHNPAAINFLAAGVADPGRGGASLKQSQWRAAQGTVTVEKRTGAGWRRASWAGLATSPAGAPIGVYGPFSDHAVAIRGGSGTVDVAAGTASLVWRGTFTVVYYAGNSVFTVSDPVLEVADGRGSVTAVLGGFVADRDDTGSWTPAAPRRVTIADLPSVTLGELGLTAAPAYHGVRVDGSQPQDLSGPHAGAFPASFVGYLRDLGVDQFWYSTGLRSDETKAPLPLTVSWSTAEVAAPPPTTDVPVEPEVENPVVVPPASPAPADPAPIPVASRSAPAAAPGPVPAAAEESSPGLRQGPRTVELTAASSATAPGPTVPRSSERLWWLGGGLLLAAALLLLLPLPVHPRKEHPCPLPPV